MGAAISVYCPPMNIYKDGAGLKRTAAEPMAATIDLPSGKLTVPNVVIPPTLVKRLRPLRWLVDACVGATAAGVIPSLWVSLPPELTVFEPRRGTMVAKAIIAPTRLVLGNGDVWVGTVTFPDCPIEILRNPMVATAITAVGVLMNDPNRRVAP